MRIRAIHVSGMCLLACALAARPAHAENMQITAAGVSLGTHVSGPVIDQQGLSGHVVVLEFWGIHCGPCIASMPKLEELHRQFGPQGMILIGAHVQGGTAEELRQAVGELGVTFTIVDGATVEGGMDFTGIPHCMVFDHTGACMFRGSPSQAHDVIVAAVQASPAAILSGRTLVKLASLAQMLKNENLCGTALKKARSLLSSPDAETADEARFVVDRIEGHGRRMLEQAREQAASDPVAAMELAQRCSAAFKGSDIATEAGHLLGEWRKDKDFQSALKAGQQLARLEALRSAAGSLPGGLPPQALAQARDIVRAIEKAWPGSEAAGRAAAIAAELGLETAAGP